MLLPSSQLVNAAERAAGLETSFWATATEIAAIHGTPFYAYFPHRAEAAFESLVSGTQSWGPAHVAYSVKTNPLCSLLRDLNRCGAYAEVTSAWEFRQARAAGFPSDRIVFNGPLKPDAELRDILTTAPLMLNVDSLDELDVLEYALGEGREPVGVGLRVCPPKVNGAWSRFGLQVETGEFAAAVARCVRNSSIRLTCIHFHLGTQLQSVERHVEIIELAKRLWTSHAFPPDVHLDIGGGFPYDHGAHFFEQPFSPANYFATLADAWGLAPRPALVIEPGRFIAAPAMAVISRVLSRKPRSNEPTIVVIDSGTNHNVMAAFYEHVSSYEGIGATTDHRFCGPLCMEDDVLSGRRLAPLPAPGALVATMNAGAYSFSLARTFIQPRPPIFRLDRDGAYEQVEQREALDRVYGSGSAASAFSGD